MYEIKSFTISGRRLMPFAELNPAEFIFEEIVVGLASGVVTADCWDKLLAW